MTPNTIQFHSDNHIEVLRLSKNGITANPEISVDEAAKLVLAAIDSNIKLLVQKAVKDEREACAMVCDQLADMHEKMNQWSSYKTADTLAQAIRARSQP